MNDQRRAVVREAMTWLRTPYHDRGRVKGVGVDCATLLAEVYTAAGVIPPPVIPDYRGDWFLHRYIEIYKNIVEQHAHPVDAPLPGDVVLWKVGRLFAHGAIVIDPGWPNIIHAWKPSRFVELANGESRCLSFRLDRDVERPRRHLFFSHW